MKARLLAPILLSLLSAAASARPMGGVAVGPLPFRPPAFGTTTVAQCPNITSSGFATISLTAGGGSRPSNGETSLCDGHSYGAGDSYEPTLDLLVTCPVQRTKGIAVNGGQHVRTIGCAIDPTSDAGNELVFVTGASADEYIEGIWATGNDNPANGQDFIDYSGVVGHGSVSITGTTTASSVYVTAVSSVVGLVDESTCTIGSATAPCMVGAGGSLLNNSILVAINPVGCTAPCLQLDRPPTASASPTIKFSFFYLPNYYVQNIKALSLHGSFNGTHSDVGQNVGPVGSINIANETAATNYQGQFNPPKYQWSSLHFQNIGITWAAYYGPLTTVTGAAKCAANSDVCVVVGSTALYATGEVSQVTGVVGTTEANGTWTLTVVDATHLDLQGTTFVNAYVSGGNVSTPNDQTTLAFAVYMTAGNAEAPYAPIGNPISFTNTFACWNRSPLYTNSVQPLSGDAVAPAVAFQTTGATWNSPINATGGIQSGCPSDYTFNLSSSITSSTYVSPGYQ